MVSDNYPFLKRIGGSLVMGGVGGKKGMRVEDFEGEEVE